MEVRTTIEITREVVVNVPLDDVMAEIASLDAPNSVHEALHLLNLCFGAVTKLPDAVLNQMTASQKAVVADALRKQLERYAPS
jgi:hypothetical protein